MHIGLVVWSLFETRGGIERVGCDLAKAMLAKGHAVTIFYKENKKHRHPQYPVPEGVVLVPLDLERAEHSTATARNVLLESGITVLITMFSWDTLLWFPAILKDTGIPWIISEHSEPPRINQRWNAYEHNGCLMAADSIHILLDSYISFYPDTLSDTLSVIGNAVTPLGFVEKTNPPSSKKNILAVGRFVDSIKQFSLLIQAFALLAPKYPDWSLCLCGSGESLEHYKQLVKELHLASVVEFPGLVTDIAPFYASASVFCIPSTVEGFSMALGEAFTAKLPVVGFSGCLSVKSLIVNGENGLLAAEMTAEALADRLAILMGDASLRKVMGERGAMMMRAYAPEIIFAAWEALLLKAAQNKGNTKLQHLDALSDVPEVAALREIVQRKHPFDRRACIQLHHERLQSGNAGFFSVKDVRSFIKKHQRYKIEKNRNVFKTILYKIRKIFT